MGFQMITEDQQDTPETSEKKRHYGKGIIVEDDLNEKLIDIAIEYRLWTSEILYAKFPKISDSYLRKRAAIMVDQGFWQVLDYPEAELLQPFIRRAVGRRPEIWGPGHQISNVRDVPDKNNKIG